MMVVVMTILRVMMIMMMMIVVVLVMMMMYLVDDSIKFCRPLFCNLARGHNIRRKRLFQTKTTPNNNHTLTTLEKHLISKQTILSTAVVYHTIPHHLQTNLFPSECSYYG